MQGNFLIHVAEFEQIRRSGLHYDGINFGLYLFGT